MSEQTSFRERMTERRFLRERRYEGKEYLRDFGTAGAFIAVGVISIILAIFRIDFIGLRWWGYVMFIPAFFILVGGIAKYTRADRLRKEVLATLDNYGESQVNVDTFAKDLIMERPSLMRLLIDLRTDGHIKFRVDSKSGELIFGQAFVPSPIDTKVTPITTTDSIYCPQCGFRIPADSLFCPSCGSSIQ
jgi:DNA-directed RNA polymerase subunit RPC12/RpoP